MPPIDPSKLLRGETPRIEYKESMQSSSPIYEATCALANDFGGSGEAGYLIIGVKKDGSVIGFTGNLDDRLQRLSSWLRATKIYPTPAFSIDLHEVDGKTIIITKIDPYPVPPRRHRRRKVLGEKRNDHHSSYGR